MISNSTRSEPRRRARALCALAATALLAATCPRPAGAATDPKGVIEGVTSKVIAVLRNDALSSDAKRTEIEAIVYANVDFETVARLVLARNWRKLSPDQQRTFVAEFKKHLSLTYGNNVDSYRNEVVAIAGEREETRGDRTVKTRIARGGGGKDILVDYRLRQHDGEWRIIDIVIEGVSLVANYRSQFQDIVASGGPERLLALLREKNAKGEPLKGAPGVAS